MKQSTSKQQRGWIIVFHILPWLAFGLVNSTILPQAWRYDFWSEPMQNLGCVVFIAFLILEFFCSLHLVTQRASSTGATPANRN